MTARVTWLTGPDALPSFGCRTMILDHPYE